MNYVPDSGVLAFAPTTSASASVYRAPAQSDAMLLSPPMPLPFSLISMDPAIRLEQRQVLKGPDPPELGLYPKMSTESLAFASLARIWD